MAFLGHLLGEETQAPLQAPGFRKPRTRPDAVASFPLSPRLERAPRGAAAVGRGRRRGAAAEGRPGDGAGDWAEEVREVGESWI